MSRTLGTCSMNIKKYKCHFVVNHSLSQAFITLTFGQCLTNDLLIGCECK